MEGANQFSIPEGYSLKASMNFKKGKFALFANLAVLFVLIIGFATIFLLFEYDTSDTLDLLIELLIKLLIFLAVLIGFILVNPLIQMIFYKVGGGGKTKLHFGMMTEVYSENAVTRNNYVLAQLFSTLIPLAALAVFAVFFWSDCIYISLLMVASNLLAYLPVYVFVLKYDKTSLVKFENGALNVFTRTA